MAEPLAAPVEFGPEKMTLSAELLRALTAGDAVLLEQLLSAEGRPQADGHVAINVVNGGGASPGALVLSPPRAAAGASCLLGVTSCGNTALHLVASRGHAKLAALLCEKAPSLVATRNRSLDTPLHCAAKAGHRDVAACLLSAMRAGGEETAAALRATNCLGATALYEAVRFRHVGLVDLLMTEAPELSSLAAEDGFSPLYLAASIDSLQMVQRIVRPSLDGTPSPASYSGPKGRTALHSAVITFREIAQEMTREILKWEPSLLTKVDSSGRTPLHLAILYQQLDVIALLLDVPTSDKLARTSDYRGLFPIHTAALVGSTGIIDKLVEKCPDYCEMVDDQGRNFLHCAIEHNQETVVRHICQNYTSAVLLNAMDYEGNTPFHLAVKYKFPRIVTLLLQNVIVEIGITNKDGQTARDLGLLGLVRGRLYYPLDPLWIVLNCLHWSGASVATDTSLVDNVPTGAEAEETSHEDYDTKSGTIGSVLIATVAFAAAFTVPGGFIADDHPSAGTAILARRFAFRAFVVSDTMAFVCSVTATSFLIFGGAREIPRDRRRMYNRMAPVLVSMGAVSMITAFAFGFDLVLGKANTGLVVFVYLACLLTVVRSSDVWVATDLVGMLTAVHRRAGWRGLFNLHQRPSGREWFRALGGSLLCKYLGWPLFLLLITAAFVVAVALNIALPNY